MPRAGQTKPPVAPRLSDRIAIGVLTTTFPPELVDRVIAKTGRAEQRQRLLPARVVVWLVLAMVPLSLLAWRRRWVAPRLEPVANGHAFLRKRGSRGVLLRRN